MTDEEPVGPPKGLGFAVWGSDLDQVRLLLDAGAPVDEWGGAGDRLGTTPLMESVDATEEVFESDRVAMVSLLLERGADVSRLDVAGRTALHYAASAGAVAVELLLAAGVPVGVVSRAGQTALEEAVERGCASAVAALENAAAS